MIKLSHNQQEVLNKTNDGKWHSAYNLGISLNSLNALVRKGFLERQAGLGSIFSPRTSIRFRKIMKEEVK